MTDIDSVAQQKMNKGKKTRREKSKVVQHLLLLLLVLVAVVPLAVLFMNSLKTPMEIGTNPLAFPRHFKISNYIEAWTRGDIGRTAFNSMIMVVMTVAMELVLAGMAAYSLGRKKPPGHDLVMIYMLVASTIPIWLYVVPLFFLWRSFGLLNTRFGLALIYTALNAPLSVFLLRSYMLGLSRDFEDAARIDGANEFQVFTRVVVRLTWPGFLTVGLVVGLAVWGEFQLALIFINDPAKAPVTTSYFRFTQRFGTDWALTSAGAVMMILPVLVFFLAMQRRFVEGLTQGGMKM